MRVKIGDKTVYITDKPLDVLDCERCGDPHERLFFRPVAQHGARVTYMTRCPVTNQQITCRFEFPSLAAKP